MTEPAGSQATGGEAAVGADPPKTPIWLRNTGAILLLMFGLSGAMNGLLVDSWPAVLLAGLIVPLAWLLTSWGKAWRAKHKVQGPGWVIGVLILGLVIAAQMGINAKTATKVTTEFAASGERRMAQVRAALQRGEVETAKAVLQPIADVANDRVKALTFAIEALEAEGGDTAKAAHALSEKARWSKEDGPIYQAAMADVSPAAAAAYAEARAREVAWAAKEAQAKAQKEAEEQAQHAEAQKYARFFSSWDGSHSQMIEAVKNNMNDPGSFKHVETTLSSGPGDTLIVNMTYRGRNGLGGVVTEEVVGTISRQDGHLIHIARAR